jgi:hypothetical protein
MMRLGMYIMAPEHTSKAYLINPSHQSACLYVYPSIVTRQRLGKSVPAATVKSQQSDVSHQLRYSVVGYCCANVIHDGWWAVHAIRMRH